MCMEPKYMNMFTAIKDAFQGKSPSISTARSSKWVTVRKQFLLKNPTCAACGGSQKLEAHHIKPFHLHPELELEESNLITLCESGRFGLNCHLLIGHNGNFRKINADVKQDAAAINKKINS